MATKRPSVGFAACLLALLAMSCGPASEDSVAPENARAEAVPAASASLDLDALLADDEALLANWTTVFEQINQTLDGVSDAATAETAVPTLDALVDGPLARLRELREDGVFRPDSGVTAVAWLREHNRFVGNVVRLGSNSAVQPVLKEPLERLMRFFEPTN
ncbi:MAG: hypothetical protein GKS06_06100 [Acidobacteria bacterium]|nr:hypothetical protein [Acidobacteriota bacterium]